MTKLTFGSGISLDPLWTPDGRFIIFDSLAREFSGPPADGSGQPQRLIEAKSILVPWSMSRDGNGWHFSRWATPTDGSTPPKSPKRVPC